MKMKKFDKSLMVGKGDFQALNHLMKIFDVEAD